MKDKTIRLLVVLFITIISLILNIVFLIKITNPEEEWRLSDKVEANNAALYDLLSGEHDSTSLADRLYYVYFMNGLHSKSEDKIIYVVFEKTEYKIMSYNSPEYGYPLEDLQKQVKSYKGNYYVEIEADAQTGYANKVILNKI